MTLRLAISSWTLHHTLGKVWHEPDGKGGYINKNEVQADALPLLALPELVRELGIHVLEICHFHFPATDDAYLAQLKEALSAANMELAYILIDTGNLSSADDVQWRADIEVNKFWMDIAAKLGAKGVRVDCGLEEATPRAIQRSADALKEIAEYGDKLGLQTITENWRMTSLEASDLLAIMQRAEHSLGLCVDFGNAAKTSNKYETLTALLPYGTSIHCKADYINGEIDDNDLLHCLSLARDANFDGHITIIYGDGGNERENIHRLMSRIDSFIRSEWVAAS